MRINTHTSHPSAFISSTFMDLRKERNAVASVLRASNLNINALDIKPASTNSSRKEIITGIRESDFIILIVGKRYGSMDRKITFKKSLSITRWEYEVAVKNSKKDVLVYFKEIDSTDTIHYDDQSFNDFQNKQDLLKQFKSELSQKHNPKYFSTTEELIEEVKKAIIPVYRAGVKTLIEKNESLTKEVASLKSELLTLKKPQNSVTNLLSTGIVASASKQPRGLLDMLDNVEKEKDQKPSRLVGLLDAYSKIDDNK